MFGTLLPSDARLQSVAPRISLGKFSATDRSRGTRGCTNCNQRTYEHVRAATSGLLRSVECALTHTVRVCSHRVTVDEYYRGSDAVIVPQALTDADLSMRESR